MSSTDSPSDNTQEFTSVIRSDNSPTKRKVKKVPFVELFSGRLQGVVSSGSDIKRVYVSFIDAETKQYYCCTNNNRTCSGLNSNICKHIEALIQEATLQYSAEDIIRYLDIALTEELEQKIADGYQLSYLIRDTLLGQQKESSGPIFSRFLNYLRYCELDAPNYKLDAMEWFV